VIQLVASNVAPGASTRLLQVMRSVGMPILSTARIDFGSSHLLDVHFKFLRIQNKLPFASADSLNIHSFHEGIVSRSRIWSYRQKKSSPMVLGRTVVWPAKSGPLGPT
jgi:hypothetical protein